MRGIVFPRDRRAEVRDLDDPVPGFAKVMIQMKALTLFDQGHTGKVILEWT